MTTRRGRGFNPREVANLRSWGVEPRPDEIEPEPSTPTPVEIGHHPGLHTPLSPMGQAILRAHVAELAAMQGIARPLPFPGDEPDP